MSAVNILNTEIFNNSLLTWGIAVGIGLAFMTVVAILRWILGRQLKSLADGSEKLLWEALLAIVRQPQSLFLCCIALFFGSIALELPDKPKAAIDTIAMVALILQSGLWANAALRASIGKYRKKKKEEDPASITTLSLITFIGRIVIWSLVLLLLLDNLGVNVTALIAGLGVGGIAVALALQTILGDLFASLSIVLDKPFVVGDFLGVGGLLGSVEYVGLKTTRLRGLSGEQLVFSNSDLLNSRIHNYGRMEERRAAFNIGVTYQTTHEKLERIPKIIREIVENIERTRFDRSHFKQHGDFALIFESVYYVLSPDYNAFMDIQQAVNLQIHKTFEQEGIEFAYPTQKLFIETSAN